MEEECGRSCWGMVEARGIHFLVDGSPFYVNGFNTYWLMVFAVDPLTRPIVASLLQQAASAGLTVGRTWAFNDGDWRALQISPGFYDETVFQALDYVISEAGQNKVRLILSLVNNWDDYGGKAQYVRWGRNAGQDLHSNDAFFSNPSLKSHFKSHIKALLTRVNTFTNVAYKDDPTIFAWELINEGRCESDPTGDTFHVWVEEMAKYVKSIDPNHMVGIGTEGFYGTCSSELIKGNPYSCAYQEGTDFIRNHQATGIDFASIHIYPTTWISGSLGPSHLSFAKKWVLDHIEDCERILKMPILFTEFGVSDRCEGYKESYRESLMRIVYESVLKCGEEGGASAGSLFWQFFPQGSGAECMKDGFEIMLSEDSSIAKLVVEQSKKLASINSRRRRCLLDLEHFQDKSEEEVSAI